jgi:hypothetical protein
MREKDPAEMVHDAERFARRNPTAFVGGAFVLGLALARFLKSSGEGHYGGRSLMHRDSDFDETDVTRNAGYGSSYGSYGSDSGLGRTGDFARSDDLSRPGSGIATNPLPGVTS